MGIGSMLILFTLRSGQYLHLFAFCALFLLFALERMRRAPIAFVLVTVSSTAWACEHGYLPSQVMWAPELVSGLLFVKVFRDRRSRHKPMELYGFGVWAAFVAVVAFSALMNGMHPISSLLFLRLLVRYYLLFLAMINMDLTEKELRWTNGLVAGIFLLQLPLALVKLGVYGQGETPLGLNGHSQTTSVVLIALSFLLAYYFIWRPSGHLLLLCMGFIGFGLVGGKRGIVFLIPMLLVYLFWRVTRNRAALLRMMALAVVIVPPSFYISARLLPTLNPERKVWGRFDPAYPFQYAKDYTTHRNEEGYADGRVSASIDVFRRLVDDGVWRLALGNGPGCLLKSMFASFDRRDDMEIQSGIGYGLTGLNWMALQVGYLGVVVFLVFLAKIERVALYCFERDEAPYWQAFGLGMAGFSFVMMYIALVYSPAYIDDCLSAFYFSLAGVLYTRVRDASTLEHAVSGQTIARSERSAGAGLAGDSGGLGVPGATATGQWG
jgi:hypothetical protein